MRRTKICRNDFLIEQVNCKWCPGGACFRLQRGYLHTNLQFIYIVEKASAEYTLRLVQDPDPAIPQDNFQIKQFNSVWHRSRLRFTLTQSCRRGVHGP